MRKSCMVAARAFENAGGVLVAADDDDDLFDEAPRAAHMKWLAYSVSAEVNVTVRLSLRGLISDPSIPWFGRDPDWATSASGNVSVPLNEHASTSSRLDQGPVRQGQSSSVPRTSSRYRHSIGVRKRDITWET